MAELLKNKYFQAQYVERLSQEVKINYLAFEGSKFINAVLNSQWQEKELKERMRHISTSLYEFLPKNYKESISILKKTFLTLKDQDGFENMIFQDFVEVYGIDDYITSIDALEKFTINCSSEFAIRRFIIKYEDQTMKQMLLWAKSSNQHIRRLASEGSRPRLPWACALPVFKKDPTKVLQILELMQDEKELYVKKSIANNLNDIAKDNIDLVVQTAQNWYGQNEDKNWIIKHGCRTLLKQGNKDILKVFGFDLDKEIILENFECSDELSLGEYLDFSFTLQSEKVLEKLRIEYSIEFLRQNNKYNEKVFFIAQKEYPGKTLTIQKKHSFKLINTRKYYNGLHKINIIVNGKNLGSKEFKLKGNQ